jgi:rod shape-determining protein MreC
VRALASGDNGAEPRLEFLPDGAKLYPGDEVYTSGSDGVLPRGLRVGRVTGSPGAFKVRPHAELSSLDVVSVLYFDTPALTRTDPPPVTAERALSPLPAGAEEPASLPSAAIEPQPADAPIKQAGAIETPAPSEGVAQAQQ